MEVKLQSNLHISTITAGNDNICEFSVATLLTFQKRRNLINKNRALFKSSKMSENDENENVILDKKNLCSLLTSSCYVDFCEAGGVSFVNMDSEVIINSKYTLCSTDFFRLKASLKK